MAVKIFVVLDSFFSPMQAHVHEHVYVHALWLTKVYTCDISHAWICGKL